MMLVTPDPVVARTEAVARVVRLECRVRALRSDVLRGLNGHDWSVDDAGELTLLVDAPWGFALTVAGNFDPHRLVVVTDSPCPEYWEDLWELQPRALAVGGCGSSDLAGILDRASRGEYFRLTPSHGSCLTPHERRLLRLCASGWENKRVARAVNLTEGTVRNGLARVFEKLGFSNRTEAALYYWGLWHLLTPEA